MDNHNQYQHYMNIVNLNYHHNFIFYYKWKWIYYQLDIIWIFIILYGLSQEHNSPYVCNETHELPDQYWVDGHLYLK